MRADTTAYCAFCDSVILSGKYCNDTCKRRHDASAKMLPQIRTLQKNILSSEDPKGDAQDCFGIMASLWFELGWDMEPSAANELADRLIYNDPR